MTDNDLRAALEWIAEPQTILESPDATGLRNYARAALAASAPDEELDFCPDCGNVPGSRRWQKAHRPAAPVALDVCSESLERYRGALQTVAQWDEWAQDWLDKNDAAIYAALSGEPTDD